MKKSIFALTCLAAAAMSCTKVASLESPEANLVSLSVSQEVPGSDDVKASLEGLNVVFNADDAISVFAGSSNNKFTTAAGGATATFAGTAASAEKYVVVSPYNEAYTVNGTTVRITIPEVQTAVKGGVDPAALISAGVTTDLSSVKLFNAVALVKVVVPSGLLVKNIQVAGGYGQNIAICGQYDFQANKDAEVNPFSLGVVAGKTSTVVTLVPQAGQTYIEEGTYYVAVRPKSTYDGGFTVAYVNENNELCKRQTRTAADIVRSHIFPLGSLNTTNYAPVTGTAVLRYADAAPQFTGGIKKMAGGSGSHTETDSKIKKIVFKAHTLYSQAYKVNDNVMSNGPASTIQIHAYLDGDVVYVCTEAPVITLYAASANLFRDFAALEEVVFNDVNTQANASFEWMFRNDVNLKSVDFGNADFSKVTSMAYMFIANKLERVNFGNTATTAATTMQSMFSQALNLKYLYLGPNFTLASNVTGMFNGTASSTTQQKDSEGHGLQCKFYSSQAVWDALNTGLNADGVNATTLFNKNRFFFTPVTAE